MEIVVRRCYCFKHIQFLSHRWQVVVELCMSRAKLLPIGDKWAHGLVNYCKFSCMLLKPFLVWVELNHWDGGCCLRHPWLCIFLWEQCCTIEVLDTAYLFLYKCLPACAEQPKTDFRKIYDQLKNDPFVKVFHKISSYYLRAQCP